MNDVRIVLCERCRSEGRLYCGHANDPNPRDCGPCPACEGTGGELIEVEPIEMEDLDIRDAGLYCFECGGAGFVNDAHSSAQ